MCFCRFFSAYRHHQREANAMSPQVGGEHQPGFDVTSAILTPWGGPVKTDHSYDIHKVGNQEMQNTAKIGQNKCQRMKLPNTDLEIAMVTV